MQGTWVAQCMTPTEWTAWAAMETEERPCADCPLEWMAERAAEDRCNREQVPLTVLPLRRPRQVSRRPRVIAIDRVRDREVTAVCPLCGTPFFGSFAGLADDVRPTCGRCGDIRSVGGQLR